MNKTRRAAITKISERLTELRDELETLKEEEQDYLDNMPESFQSGDKGQAAEAAVNALEYAYDGFDDILTNLEEASE